MPVPAASEHSRSPAFKCTPCLGRACGLLSGAHCLGQWPAGGLERGGSRAGTSASSRAGWLLRGRVCPGGTEQPRPCGQSRVLPVQMFGGGPGCHMPSASGGHLAYVCPSSGFNEAQEGLHGLPDHPWPVCQSLALTLLGKRPSSSMGACPCPPSCLLPAEASQWDLTCL